MSKSADASRYTFSSLLKVVTDPDGIRTAHDTLRSRIDELENGGRLLVALDSEWGAKGDEPGGSPSIIQMAALDQVLLLDCSLELALPSLQIFLHWLTSCDRVAMLGFAFAHDIAKITALRRT